LAGWRARQAMNSSTVVGRINSNRGRGSLMTLSS
jgi:hypothetical protein